MKEKLREALKIKGEWDTARRDLQQIVTDLQRLNADQDRIRKNLRETPKEAEVYATYLKKLNDQEKEIDALTAKQKSLMTDEFDAARSTTTTSPISLEWSDGRSKSKARDNTSAGFRLWIRCDYERREVETVRQFVPPEAAHRVALLRDLPPAQRSSTKSTAASRVNDICRPSLRLSFRLAASAIRAVAGARTRPMPSIRASE